MKEGETQATLQKISDIFRSTLSLGFKTTVSDEQLKNVITRLYFYLNKKKNES